MTEDDRRLGMLQSKGLQRVGHDWTTEGQQQQQQAMPASLCLIKSFCTHTHTKWFVTPAWTCSFHQDEGLDDTGWTLI